MQWYTQRVLRDTVLKAGGRSGAAIVLDMRTGEVLALADYPTFDANRSTESPKADLGSRALRDVYEPGSVAEGAHVSLAARRGKVTPRTRIVVPGGLAVQRPRPSATGSPTAGSSSPLAGVLARSSNIGTVLAARELGAQQHYQTADRRSGSAPAPTSA